MVALLLAVLMLTSLAPRRSGDGVETPGNTGPPVENAAAAQELKRLLFSSLRATLRLLPLFNE